jgi:S1-C subfamily serine protease
MKELLDKLKAEGLTEEQAMKAAVARVAPSVVRIETLGGLETVGNLLVGTGPTTGLIVSSDGYVISSAFNFINKPTQILVYLADGTRLPAQLAGRDDSRMLVLLKVPTSGLDVKKQLPVPAAAPVTEIRVGQWAIAVGRVFDGDQTNLSVGIISAVNRVWGKAVQTDAKISPANYGGPLVDLEGRVLGVLVPMAPPRMLCQVSPATEIMPRLAVMPSRPRPSATTSWPTRASRRTSPPTTRSRTSAPSTASTSPCTCTRAASASSPATT